MKKDEYDPLGIITTIDKPEKICCKEIGMGMKGVESSLKMVALLRNRELRLDKYGRGSDPCANIRMPAHGSMYNCMDEVIIVY